MLVAFKLIESETKFKLSVPSKFILADFKEVIYESSVIFCLLINAILLEFVFKLDIPSKSKYPLSFTILTNFCCDIILLKLINYIKNTYLP